ncbi:hypothetical protein TRICI_001072 [Trichomonascus ciferrii]|uniref:Cytochrome P450 n=1 Tax=Trichomonascus ciferrii TaxID=44093 RepID=A0A642VCT6_9ASCO|nr:hypothetical protein TRICI_001072 [Trichomonascus ciferrii]
MLLLYVPLTILVGVVGFYLTSWIQEIQYRRTCKKYNCAPAYMYPNKWMGMDILLESFKRAAQHDYLEYTRSLMEKPNKKTIRVNVLGNVAIQTTDPQNVKAILATQFKEYDLGLKHLQMFPLLGHGIFTLSGDGWHHSRSLLRPQFANDQITGFDGIKKHTDLLIELFKHKSARGKDFDVQPLFLELTMDTSTEYLYGSGTETLSAEFDDNEEETEGQRFAEAFAIAGTWCFKRALASRLYFLVTSKEFRDALKLCQEYVDRHVYRALEVAEERDRREKAGEEKTESERYVFLYELTKQTRDPVLMRDQSLNVLLAGKDTTGGVLTYSIGMLLRYKRVWNKLRAVVLETFGKNTDEITFSNLKKCEYLRCFINEVLRLYPSVPVNSRSSIMNTTLPRGGGPDETEPVYVPKGTNIVYSTYAMHRSKDLWGEDADEFRPERWLENKTIPWSYIPFSGGPRICLGQQFALTEASFVIVRLLQEFKDVVSDDDLTKNNGAIAQEVALASFSAHGVHARFVEDDT